MKRIDLRKELKHLYNPSPKEVELVRVPEFRFLMVDGRGDPNSSTEFHNAIQMLYALSYTMKFKFRFEKGIDYPVMALEGLWSMADNATFDQDRRNDWQWTLMILQPRIVTKSLMKKALVEVEQKKNLEAPASLRLETFKEGLSVQVMHLGPYAEETHSLRKLDEFVAAHGLEMKYKHHEIYMSDPRRAKPQNMKTILRHPVKKQIR